MPDKDVMVQIKAREDQRAWAALDRLVNVQTMTGDEREGLSAALAELAEDMRATADLYEKAKLKGAKTSHIDPLRHAALQLDIEVMQLEQPRRAPAGQLQPPAPAPAKDRAEIERDAGLDEAVHAFKPSEQNDGRCTTMVVRGGEEMACMRYASHPAHRPTAPMTPATPQGLDALIEDSVAEARGTVQAVNAAHAAAIEKAYPGTPVVITPPSAWLPEPGEVEAYLRGEIDDLPADPPRALVGAHDQTEVPPVTAEEMAAYRRGEIDPESELHAYVSDPRVQIIEPRTAREILETTTVTMPAIPPAPLLGQPGDAGSGYDHRYIPAGGVPMTYAELMAPVPFAALPPHLSHSQIGTLGECPTKYRATRLPRLGAFGDSNPTGMAETPEIPQWANIGGTAFHAVIEDIERNGRDIGGDPADAAAHWNAAFDAEIQKIEASSPVPRARWRPANGGQEHEMWWRVEGPKMIERYLAARPVDSTALIPTGETSLDGLPMSESAIELERVVEVPGPYGLLPFKVIFDRVTVRTEADGSVTLVIRDYKTARDRVTDTQQLGEYANALRLLGVPPHVKIVGTYFNARKGEWTKEVEVEREWSAEWFSYYVHSGYAQRLALTAGPTPARPTTFCGGCSVRWACPVKTPRPVTP